MLFNKIITKVKEMKKSIIVLLVLISGYSGAFAQTDAQFTLFPWASMYYNAGATGEQSNTLCFTGIFRQQWTGFTDVYKDENNILQKDNTSPQQTLFNLETYSRKIRGAFGISFLQDKIAYFKNIGVRLGYAYKLNLPGGKLGIGAQIGFLNSQLDMGKLRPGQSGDPILVGSSEDSHMDLDFNFGLYYKAERWFAGVSSTQTFGGIRISGDDIVNLSPQLFISGGYYWTLPWDPSWTIEPQALVKTDYKSFQLDFMVLARYNGILWGGLSYRIQDAVSIVFGARPFYNSSNNYLKGLDIGLSYGITTSKLGFTQNRSYGDIEVMVRYCFDIFKEEVFSGYGSTRSIYKNQY